jgi:hypothetical protein
MTDANRNPNTLLGLLNGQIADLDIAIGSKEGSAAPVEVTQDVLIRQLARVTECLKLVSECLENLGREPDSDERSRQGRPGVDDQPPPARDTYGQGCPAPQGRDADSSAGFLGGALAEDGEI